MIYILNTCKFNLKIHFVYGVLWDIEILTCWYFKTTGSILMKFTGYSKWMNRGLCTNFQNNLKFYIKIRIFSFKGYRCFLWSYRYTEKLKELCN